MSPKFSEDELKRIRMEEQEEQEEDKRRKKEKASKINKRNKKKDMNKGVTDNGKD